MEEDLRTRIRADAAVSAIIAGRVDWGIRPQASALSAITLTLVSCVPSYTYAGRTSLGWSRVQADCWGASQKDAVTLARLLPPLLLERADVGTTHFEPSFVDGEQDAAPEEANGGGLIFRRIIDFVVWHRPAN